MTDLSLRPLVALALALQASPCALPEPVPAVVATVTSWPEDGPAEALFEARAVAPADEQAADAGPAGRLAGGPAGLGPLGKVGQRVPRHPGPWLVVYQKTSLP